MTNLSNKGLSLIELIVSLGLLGLIMLLVFSFFISNLNTFNRQNDELELQYQAQSIMYYLIDKNKSASGIEEIKTKNGQVDLANNSIADNITEIEFKTDSIHNSKFKLSYGNLKYNFKESQVANTEIANYIHNIKMMSIQGNFAETRGIIFEITLKKNNSMKKINTKLYFRNSF